MLYLHRWDDSATEPETLACLEALRRAGQFRALGISNVGAADQRRFVDLQRARGFASVTAVQNNHNVAVRGVDAALRMICREHGIAIVTYSPPGAGFLTGKYRDGVAPGTRFAVVPGHQRVYFTPDARRRLERLEAVAAHSGRAQTELAFAWALHQPDVDTVLVGGRSPSNLDRAIAARAFPDLALLGELEVE